MKKYVLFCLLLVCILVNCATPEKYLTREEWLQMTTHEFPHKTVDEVLSAAEKVLRLSDSASDIKIYHLPNKMVGSRFYTIYAVFAAEMGQYHFDCTAYEDKESGSIKTQLLIGHSCQGIAPTMTYTPGVQGGFQGMGATATTTPVNIGQPIDKPEVYNLFYTRIESLLYGKQWITCDQAINTLPKVPGKKYEPGDETLRLEDSFGDYVDVSPYHALCLNAKDKTPEMDKR